MKKLLKPLLYLIVFLGILLLPGLIAWIEVSFIWMDITIVFRSVDNRITLLFITGTIGLFSAIGCGMTGLITDTVEYLLE